MRSRRLLPLALGLLFIAAGSSCKVTDEQSFVILQANELASGSGGTVACSTDIGKFVSSGKLDLALARAFQRGYILCPAVKNNRISQNAGGSETMRIIMTGIDVDIVFADPAHNALFTMQELSFRLPIYSFLDPGASAFVATDAIPAAVAKKLADSGVANATATVSVRIVGTNNGGTTTSNIMPFTIQICSGCLQTVVSPMCCEEGTGGSPNIVQDAPVDCCMSSTGALRCPSVDEGTAAGCP